MKDPYIIYLKSYSGNKVKLPVLPSELPEVSQSADITDFTSVKGGHYTIIGQRQQPTLSAEHLVPQKSKKLQFAVSSATGKQVIKILKEAQRNRTPVKYTIAKKDGGYYVNQRFAVASFSYRVDRKNDYVISFELTGWKKYAGWKKAAKA